MKFTVAVVLSLGLFLPTLTRAQSEGDVRLAGADNTVRGRLEIYWQGKWGTFCSISSRGADAACKQLGFAYSFTFFNYNNRGGVKFNVTKADADTPIAIANTYCSDSVQHVLRCDASFQVPSTCSHDNDIIVFCIPSSLWQHPYQTQVRLNSSTYLSTGVLEMYANEKWGNVCGNKFDKEAANSTCRQMGYTGAQSFSKSSNATTSTTWLSGVTCASKGHSCNCLNGCFGKAPSEPAHCTAGNYVGVTCTFDVKAANSTKAGDYNDCSNYQGTCNQGSGVSVTVAVTVVVVIFVVVAVTIFAVALAYFAVSARKKRGYYSIDADT